MANVTVMNVHSKLSVPLVSALPWSRPDCWRRSLLPAQPVARLKQRFLLLLGLAAVVLTTRGQTNSLQISRTGAGLRTTWTDPAAVLLQAEQLGGPWDVVPTLSPYPVPPTNNAQFFRLVHGTGSDIVGSLSVIPPGVPSQSPIRIPGLGVYLVDLTTLVPTGRATTDFNGIFILPALPPGHYQLCWEAPGYISGCSTQHIAVVGDVVYYEAEGPLTLASGSTHALSGQLSFLDDSPLRQKDAFFNIDSQTTVRVEDAKGGLIASTIPNASGRFVLTGLPNLGSGNLVAACEDASVTLPIAFSQTDAGTLYLPNHRPQISSLAATLHGNSIARAAPGTTVTLTATARDPDGDPLEYYWVPSLSQGTFLSSNSNQVQWTLPTASGVQIMYVRVSDHRGGYATARVRVSTAAERIFSGQVLDVFGAPVAGATVTVSSNNVTTDDAGTFTLAVTNDSPSYVVGINKTGFTPLSQVFEEESPGRTYTLYQPETFAIPSAAQAISVQDSQGTALFVPANSLNRLDGQGIVNPLTVFLTTINPCNPLLESPVSTLSIDSKGSNSFLSSLSTAHVQIRDASGAPLVPKAGTATSLSLPFSSACAANYSPPPPDAGIWTYDFPTASWTRSGTATYQAGQPGVAAAYVLTAIALNFNTYTAVDPSGPYSSITLTVDRTLALPIDLRVTGPSFAYTRTMVASPLTLFFAPATPVTFSVLNPKQAPGSYFSDPTNSLTAPTPDTAKTVILQVITNSPAAYLGILVPLKLGLQVAALSTKVEVAEPFLTHNYGTGGATEAASYYAAIDPGNQKTTLAAWKSINGYGAGDEASAAYFNASDLGFGRQMHLRRKVGSDSNTDTAFYVSNFDTVDHARTGFGLIATVAMDYALDPTHVSLGRYVKFYVFDSAGNRVDRANLDGGGDKYVPELCEICHGGNHSSSGTAATGWNLNAKFIAFDMDSYTYSTATGYKPSALHNAFRTMNLAIRDNTSPTTAITALINGWYGVSGTGTFNRDFVPTAWLGVTDLPVYRDAVKVSCRACHTTRGNDFTTPSSVGSCGYNACDVLVMPDAQRTFSILWGSRTANVGGTGTPPNQPSILSTRYGPINWTPCP